MKNNLKKHEEPILEIIEISTNAIMAGSECPGETCTDCASDCNPECLAAGTKISMADGSFRNIEDVLEGDIVLSFDHESGKFVGSRVCLAYKGDGEKCAYTLHFEDGTEFSIIGKHDLFEKESNRYVTISENDAESFVGKHYYSVTKKSFVKLIDVVHETEKTAYYEVYAAGTLNIVANGMLNVADDVDYMLNLYSFGENMKADADVLVSDMQKYGLYDFSNKHGFTNQEFQDWNTRYLNITVGKGLMTMDAIVSLHNGYLSQR